MSQEQNSSKKTAADNFGEMLRVFGEAISKIFNDPELKGSKNGEKEDHPNHKW